MVIAVYKLCTSRPVHQLAETASYGVERLHGVPLLHSSGTEGRGFESSRAH